MNRNFTKIGGGLLHAFDFRRRIGRIKETPLYRNASYLIAQSAVSALLGFFFWMAAARVYSDSQVGLASGVVSAVNLLTLFCLVGLNFSLIRFLAQSERPHRLINSSLTITTLLGLIAGGIFLAGVHWWTPALVFLREEPLSVFIFLALIVLSLVLGLTDSVSVARRQARFVLLSNTTASLLKLGLVVAFSLVSYSFGIVTSWTIGLAVAAAISLFIFLPMLEPGYRPALKLGSREIEGLTRYSVYSYVASLLTRGPTLALPILVLNVLGTESNAYFYVAWRIADTLFSIPSAISQSLFAESAYSPAALKDNVVRSIKFNVVLLLLAVVVFGLAARWVLLAFGQNYADNALYLLWLLTLAALPLGINYIYVSVLRVRDRLKELIIVRGFVAVAAPVISMLVMPYIGIIGVGYAWLGAQTVLAVVSVVRLRSLTDGLRKQQN